MSRVYQKLKKRQGWEIDPNFLQIERALDNMLSDLPADLCVNFPADGSPPWLPSALLGNVHSYHYLTVILFNRPLLSYLDPTNNEAEWKRHMMICYNAAKCLCRLQEAVLAAFGLAGLQNMQRGSSFTLYGGLSCIVLHLSHERSNH
ncbi:hypothetical protein ESCO_005101 [Escovopsis weberi]|uniref:Uncharacterized protein n=1 Tax=Escovopsis weberi TaxID=150374 RepID=A0A0M8N671_ESCWE|nr:hypothetical protein ESCO_005101 [Escovopsis weberi]